MGHKRDKRDKRDKQDHRAQANSPAQIAQAKAQAQEQEAKAQEQEAQTKAGLTVDRNITTDQTKATDSQGQPVLTKEDRARIETVKAAQVKATEARRTALEAQRQAKEALEELNNGGSGAIKVLRGELEAKIKAQEAQIEARQASLKAELTALNDLYTEYKGLTGLDKTTKAKTGEAKAKAPANGRFNTTVKLNGNSIKVLVTHKESKAQFESGLYPANGQVKLDDWKALRHRFIAFFEEAKHKGNTDKSLSGQDYNLTLRAFLSNLKGKIEAVKPII